MYPAHPVCRLLPAAHGVWAAKTAANRLAKLRPRFLQRGAVSIAPKGDAVKGLQAPDHGSRLGEKRQRHAMATLSAAKRPNSIAQASGLGRRPKPHNTRPNGPSPPWPASHGPLGLGTASREPDPPGLRPGLSGSAPLGPVRGRVPPNSGPPNATAPRGKSGLRPAQARGQRNKNATKNRLVWQPTLRGCESIDCTSARPQSVGCVKRTMHDGLWCVSRTLQKFTASPCAAFFRRHGVCRMQFGLLVVFQHLAKKPAPSKCEAGFFLPLQEGEHALTRRLAAPAFQLNAIPRFPTGKPRRPWIAGKPRKKCRSTGTPPHRTLGWLR